MKNNKRKPLLTIHYPPNKQYKCVNCGTCCQQVWNIHISQDEYDNLKKSDLYREVLKKNRPGEILIQDEESGRKFIKNIRGHCAMLNERNLCSIHEGMGVESKPHSCRQLPFILVSTPDGIYAGVSYVCPQVWENSGKKISDYNDEILRLIEEPSHMDTVEDEISLSHGIKTNWQGYRVIEKFVSEGLELNKPLPVRLWDSLMAIILTEQNFVRDDLKQVDPEQLARGLEETARQKIEKDQLFVIHERNLAYGILSLMESTNNKVTRKNTKTLLEGGTIYCRSFHKKIDINQLIEFAAAHPAHWRDDYFYKYVRHLLWRKFLVKNQPLTDSLSILNALHQLFTWYFYASAFSRGAACPDANDAKFAINRVEFLVYHHRIFNVIQPFGRLYTDSLKAQVQTIIAPEDPEKTKA